MEPARFSRGFLRTLPASVRTESDARYSPFSNAFILQENRTKICRGFPDNYVVAL
jgi:hypothetical protein